MEPISTANYQNEFVNTFPGDNTGNKRPRQTPGVLYSNVLPTPVQKPELLAWSDSLAAELALDRPKEGHDVDLLAGNYTAPSMLPYAACYAGHQFGNWAGQLGDGRAITLGELQDINGNPRELQLKGAGPTPYSRRADGRAVLRSSVREYLMSEAMHYLGVPTTRALSLVTTGDPVLRDMFYDGHPAHEPGAIVLRVAPSFLRFGNFEMLAARNELSHLRQLVEWTIDRYYPHLQGENKILQWFGEVVQRTASLVVEWLRVGFVHGVMNTDNMSILGLSIDYGPYSFLDDYDPDFTPNTTDLPGRRYAFSKQASVAKWNLGCLGGAIAPLLKDTTELLALLEDYDRLYWEHYYRMMGAKLGLDALRPTDPALFALFEKTLSTLKPDMTLFYALLSSLEEVSVNDGTAHFAKAFYQPLTAMEQETFGSLLLQYQTRISANNISRKDSVQKMQAANPRFVLRNYLLHNAIEELQAGRRTVFDQLEKAMQLPYTSAGDVFFEKRPDWATSKAGCSMLSCSS